MSEQFTTYDYVIPLDIPFDKLMRRVRKMEDEATAEIIDDVSEVRMKKSERFSYALNQKTGLVVLELTNIAGSALPSCRELFLDIAKELDGSEIAASLDIIKNGLGTSYIYYRKDGEGQTPD